MSRTLLYDLEFPALQALLEGWGEPRYRARQVWEWLYVHLADDFDRMTNLPKALRRRLAEETVIGVPEVVDTLVSSDGQTRKDLLRLQDGETVEVVLMRYERRRTVCVSTQVGCPIGCVFCATGQAGFRRNLTAGEIVAQVLHFARVLRAEGERVTNVVLMGMGEPLLNYDASLAAIRRLIDPQGFRLGQRHITLSTVGIVPGIDRLSREKGIGTPVEGPAGVPVGAQLIAPQREPPTPQREPPEKPQQTPQREPSEKPQQTPQREPPEKPPGKPLQITLAVSLHAATDDLRDQLVPINRKYPLDELFAACHRYVERTGRRISFEWALIAGVNDSTVQAEALAARLSGLRAHVNLIPLNPTPTYEGKPSPPEAIAAFTAVLDRHRIPYTLRLRRGIEIQAGCGQLRYRALSEATG